ncbi:uncharacterized protein HMPREF1541_08480 [Cyphellophora europaea CBS 101466]|uniref:ABC transporter domain-containing protein n=1 Tax=Cyphellophora europaea (strain CBS 101466) TaxID=1220924 RepID=W2RKF2_CYPE1|nr:uncharacterized protein HMPREF1541_08480 [Cyphellophora europaea CBS 101466]ETN36203.1 hypothetical protein HMPREF1541_08480 [Cyphellophora europaea CBS 101466]
MKYQSMPKDDDGESDDDDESECERPIFSAAHKDAVKQKGGLFGYLAQFKVFLPYLWPSAERKLQAYFCVIGLNILAERALNVLYPRQFGIVVDKLYLVVSAGGPVPVQEILLWILYELLLQEACGLPALSEFLEIRVSNRTRLRLSVAAFDHVMGLPMSFHDSKASGELIKAVEQAGSMSSLLRMLALETAPFLIDVVVALWYVNAILGIYGAVIVLYVGVAFSFVTYTISIVMAKARRTYAADSRSQSQLLYETISNWSTVSFFNRHRHEHERLFDTASTAISSSQWDNDVAIYIFAAQQFIEIAGRLATALLSAYRIALGLSPVGIFVAIEVYWDSVTRPLWHLSYNFRQLSSDLIDAERLLELFQQSSDIKDGPRTLPSFLSGEIEFSDVDFGYNAEQITLKNVSFRAKPGQTIAIVGETGSGKSTVLKLLMRFYDVASGSIKVDGVDLRDVTVQSLREAFGFVPQNAVLFNASIFENVRYGRLNATVEEVHCACRAAAIHDRIMSFPRGYDTKAGERGVKLSGGELQRIAIARVMLRNPQIVLLDEATSALDTETESKIQDALRSLTTGRTTIVIAHRLSTIVDADMILMLNQGKIIERGTHSFLLQQNGKYKDYWFQQTRTPPVVSED